MEETKNIVVRNPSPEQIEKETEGKHVETEVIHRSPYVVSTNPFEPKPFPLTLPSGKLVQEAENGILYVRRMTTIEEGIIQINISNLIKMGEELTILQFFKIFNDVLENCIKADVKIKSLPLTDKLALIIFIIIKTYGSKIKDTYKCNFCGKEHIIETDLECLKIDIMPEDFLPKMFSTTSFDFEVIIDLTVPTINDEAHFFGTVPNLIKQFSSIIKTVSGTKPDGTQITNDDIQNIVENLNPVDKDVLGKFISDVLDFGYNLKVDNAFECKDPECPGINKKPKERKQPITINITTIFNKLL